MPIDTAEALALSIVPSDKLIRISMLVVSYCN